MERHRNMCGMKMIYFSHFRFPSSGAHSNTSVREGENRKLDGIEDESVFVFSLRLFFCLSLTVLSCGGVYTLLSTFLWRWDSSGFAGNILCMHLDPGALAILVCNRGWFLHSRLQLNKKAILMKCEKWTYWHDTSKSIYILNWISNFWLRHK